MLHFLARKMSSLVCLKKIKKKRPNIYFILKDEICRLIFNITLEINIKITFYSNDGAFIMASYAYLRVSTRNQDNERQELTIRRYAELAGIPVDQWIKYEVSSRKSFAARGIDILLDRLQEGDTLLVAELSRLGRSISQIILLIDSILKKGVSFHSVKEGMHFNGSMDMTGKIQLTMFSLLAELERDLISSRTKEGLEAAKEKGKLIGRPKGLGKSKLDGHEKKIKEWITLGVSQASVAKMLGVSAPTLHHFLVTRNLKIKF